LLLLEAYHKSKRFVIVAFAFVCQVEETNRQLVASLLDIAACSGWEQISSSNDVEVFKMTLSPDHEVAGRAIKEEAKFAIVKAQAVLDAAPEQVYAYFMDNKRVHEYNEYCTQVEDLEYLDATTKISWSCSGPIASGAISARDFVTRSHYCALDDGTLIVANRAEEHAKAPPSGAFVRMKMIWGGNIIRRHGRDQTLLTTITHINPGGAGETRYGSIFLNATAASGKLAAYLSHIRSFYEFLIFVIRIAEWHKCSASGPRKFMDGLRACIEYDRQERTRSDSLASCCTSSVSSADTEESLAFAHSSTVEGWGSWLWGSGTGTSCMRTVSPREAGGHEETESEAVFVAKLHEQLAVWQRRARMATCTL